MAALYELPDVFKLFVERVGVSPVCPLRLVVDSSISVEVTSSPARARSLGRFIRTTGLPTTLSARRRRRVGHVVLSSRVKHKTGHVHSLALRALGSVGRSVLDLPFPPSSSLTPRSVAIASQRSLNSEQRAWNAVDWRWTMERPSRSSGMEP